MSTCKDCIHYDVCEVSSVFYGGEAARQRFREYAKRADVECGCNCFTDKSLYIKLPCKVGDMVFEIIKISHREEIAESVVEKVVLTKTGFRIKLSRNKMYETSCRSIGKTVFLTREEAEKALEESQ